MPAGVAGGEPALFHLLDHVRRRQGNLLDSLGLGPETTPSRIVLAEPGFRLRVYGGEGAPAVLVVPAPIKRHYIWDLEPGVSVVRRLAGAGFPTYLVEWLEQPAGTPSGGLAEQAGHLLDRAVAAVEADSGRPRPVLAGHSLGGTLAAIFTASRPGRVRGLVLLEAPLRFGPEAGALAPLVAASPGAAGITATYGDAPGSLLTYGSLAAAPDSFLWSVLADRLQSWGDPEARRRHGRVRRWTLDEFPMPARLFEEVVEHLYREDRFARGTLTLDGVPAAASAIDCPVLAVVDPDSRVVPRGSAVPPVPAFARPESLVLEHSGDRGVALRHVAALVGPALHAGLWPRILNWIGDRAGQAAPPTARRKPGSATA